MNIKTLSQMVDALDTLYGNNVFIKYISKEGGWTDIKAKEAQELIYSLSAGLLSLGLKKGDKVSIISDTRYEWSIMDFAMMLIGIISVPVYPSITEEQTTYLIKHSDSKAVIVEKQRHLDKFKPYLNDDLKDVKNVIIFENDGNKKDNVISFEELERVGINEINEKGKDHIKKIADTVKEDDLASIIYTSGTTGVPKGVMLNHRNFVTNGLESYERLELQPFDRTLIFLPLSHAYARTCNYNMMSGGITLCYAESVGTLGRDMQETSPQFIVGVPRVYEKMYDRIVRNAESSGGVKKIIFNWAKKKATRYAEKKQNNKSLSPFFKLTYKIADSLVYKKIKAKTGGKLTFIQSGASALPKYISYFFTGIGIHVLEGYGLTEASPIISSNNIRQNKLGTVGLPLKSTELRLADDKELMVKGPNVMVGYYKNEEATKEVITEDGWLKTGDICDIDNDGYLRVIERKKDLIKTSAGKYIVPQQIENKAKINKYIDEFVVIAENKKFASALIQPEFDALKDYCKEQNISYENKEELVQKEEIRTLFRKILDEDVNKGLSEYESIKKFILINEPLSIEKGELTPTLKVKRKAVYKKYENEISALYHNKQNY